MYVSIQMADKNTKNFLSVVIITRNEEKNIYRCLTSVNKIADDIVVIDSGSVDKTEEICLKAGARFISKTWEGYAKTKNFANQQAHYDWILSLDADEELSEELQNEILKIKINPKTHYFIFNRITNYCGQWIKNCGWYPDYKLRIFDRRYAQWEGEYVHEKLKVNEKNAQIVKLKGLCHHYSFNSISDHILQINKYSDLAAQQMFDQNRKPWLIIGYFKAVFTFFNRYFLKKGFLDGKFGFIICYNTAFAKYLRYAKLVEKRGEGKF